MSIVIKGGLLALEEGPVRADILIEGEKIAGIGEGFAAEDCQVIDAGGLLVLPGGIDVHTHFNIDVGVRSVDDFTSGTVSAVFGGTTTIVDHMGFGPAGCDLHHQLEVYRGYTDGKCIADYGIHGVVQHVDDRILDEIPSMISEGIPSMKIYLTYDYRLGDEDIIRFLDRMRREGGLTAVHCENHAVLTWLRQKYVREGKLQAKYHPLSRPAYCEAEAVDRMISLAQAAGNAPLYIVHVSTGQAACLIRAARRAGLPVYGETCPQYLVLDDSSYEDPQEGLKYIMSPPLRAKEQQDFLWKGLREGYLQTVATDHCSFDMHGDKQLGKDDFTKCPNGAPGVELRLPILFSEGVKKKRIDLNTFVRVVSTNPAKLFGLYPRKGTIKVGSDADLVLLDPDMEVKIRKNILHDNADYTPYEGMKAAGWPVMTLIRGHKVVENERLCVKEGFGQFLARKPFTVDLFD